ncbi:TPA: SGNH/GDSL hydrolase family protein, partial [Acinetobacter baumannii]
MADEIVTRQQLVDAGLDAESLQKFISGLDSEDVLTRLGQIYPTLAKLVRILMETGGWKAYETEAILLATTPLVNPSVGYAFDTKKLYLWNGTIWKDEGKSPLDVAKAYTDSFSSLTKNSTVYHPFSTRKRNNVIESTVPATHIAYLKPYILNIRVMNANKDQYYRVQQISNPDHATAANRWIFEVLARTSFDTAETSIKTITAVLPIVKNTGIRTYLVEDGDVKIAITLDTNKCPAFDFYSVASTDSSYTYIIDPSLYFYAAVGSSDLAVINKRIDGFIKPMQLQNLLKDLRNPIQSVQINLIGDSITYGYGATDNGAGPTPPHGPATTKTWANSVRDYLGTAFCTSERFDDTILETGEAYYT